MKPYTKMMLVTNARSRGQERSPENRQRETMNYPESNYAEMGYSQAEGNYGQMENRFRDRRGREHYDNGRFAPRNEMGEMESRRRRDSRGRFRSEGEMNAGEMNSGEMRSEDENRMGMNYNAESAYSAYPFPVYERGGEGMNQIGFRTGQEMTNNYRMEATMPHSNEMEYQTGEKMQGYSRSHTPKMTREMAEEWMRGLKNEDGTKGPHWTMEQTRQVMSQKGIQCDPIKFWAALNASYSDLAAIAKKHNVSNMDFFTDYAVAFWLKDKDAVDDKLAAYYEYVAKK